MPVSPKHASRRYVDICQRNFSRWGVWDPARGPKIGSYGLVNVETGAMDVEGNVYDPEFQACVDECGGITMKDYPPIYTEETFNPIMSSMWSRNKAFAAPPEAPANVNAASTKGRWWFQKGKSCAVLLMHDSREEVLPGPVLEELFKVPLLRCKHLVTNVIHCAAYARYLSSTSGEDITLALQGSGSGSGDPRPEFAWWTQGTDVGYLHTGASRTGERCYTPLFTLQKVLPLTHVILQDSTPEDLWCPTFPPWDPLDDEGIEVPVYDDESE